MTADPDLAEIRAADTRAAEAHRASIRSWMDSPEARRRWWPADDDTEAWAGVARMASARRTAGVHLSAKDIEALRRADADELSAADG